MAIMIDDGYGYDDEDVNEDDEMMRMKKKMMM